MQSLAHQINDYGATCDQLPFAATAAAKKKANKTKTLGNASCYRTILYIIIAMVASTLVLVGGGLVLGAVQTDELHMNKHTKKTRRAGCGKHSDKFLDKREEESGKPEIGMEEPAVEDEPVVVRVKPDEKAAAEPVTEVGETEEGSEKEVKEAVEDAKPTDGWVSIPIDSHNVDFSKVTKIQDGECKQKLECGESDEVPEVFQEAENETHDDGKTVEKPESSLDQNDLKLQQLLRDALSVLTMHNRHLDGAFGDLYLDRVPDEEGCLEHYLQQRHPHEREAVMRLYHQTAPPQAPPRQETNAPKSNKMPLWCSNVILAFHFLIFIGLWIGLLFVVKMASGKSELFHTGNVILTSCGWFVILCCYLVYYFKL